MTDNKNFELALLGKAVLNVLGRPVAVTNGRAELAVITEVNGKYALVSDTESDLLELVPLATLAEQRMIFPSLTEARDYARRNRLDIVSAE